MRRSPTTPSLHELLKSGLGARKHYANSRDFLQFIAGSTLEELIAPALEDEEAWELTLVLGVDSTGFQVDRAPVDRAVRRSDPDVSASDSDPDSVARLAPARS